MNLETIYKNKPYIFDISAKDKDGEELALKILKSIGYPDATNISFLSSNADYDSFKASSGNRSICFKYSLDELSPFFSREFNVLKQLCPFSPSAEKHGSIKFGDKIQYLVTSFEAAENVKEFGISSIFENLDSFVYSFYQLSRVRTDRTFGQYLKDFFGRNDFTKLPEHCLQSIKESSKFNNLSQVFEILRNEIEYLAQQNFIKNTEFCHGNLKPSNILVRGGLFKFIDLNDSFMGNRFLDFIHLLLNIGLDLELQKEIIRGIFEKLGQEFPEEKIAEYNNCYNLQIRIILYKLMFDYLVEVYLYESSRPNKLLAIVDLFLRNQESFKNIPNIQKYSDFLFNDIMEPMIGSEDS